jgi:hypothetical protein
MAGRYIVVFSSGLDSPGLSPYISVRLQYPRKGITIVHCAHPSNVLASDYFCSGRD